MYQLLRVQLRMLNMTFSLFQRFGLDALAAAVAPLCLCLTLSSSAVWPTSPAKHLMAAKMYSCVFHSAAYVRTCFTRYLAGNVAQVIMKGTSALALLASTATVSAFVAPPVVASRPAAAPSASVRMSAADKVAEAASSVVDAVGLNVRKPPGDVKLDQAVMDR